MRNPANKIIATFLVAVMLLLTAVVSQTLDMGSHALGDSESPLLGDSGSDLALGASADYILGEEGALVGSYEELVAAISAREEYIRLTASFDMTNSIEVDYDFILDGRKQDNSGNWSISETGDWNVFQLKGTGRHIEIQNLNITGYNHYGFVTQERNKNESRDCTVIYRDVHYSGPQLAWLTYDGTLEIYDSTIDLKASPGGINSEELAEVAQYVLGGQVTITKHDGVNSLFWLFNNTGTTNRYKTGFIQILDRAQVKVYNSQTYLFHREDQVGIPNFDFTIGDGATVDLFAQRGWCETEARFINRFEIGQNATVTMARSAANSTALFYVRDAIKVGKGSTWILEDSIPTLSIGVNRTELILDEPRLVRIEQGLARNSFSSVDIRARAVNYWQSNAVTGKPDGQFNAPHGEMVTLTGNDGGATFSYFDGDTGLPVTSSGTSFVPTVNTKLFVAGDYDLDVDILTAYTTTIGGEANGDTSTLYATYFPRGSDTSDPANYRSAAATFGPGSGWPRKDFEIVPGIAQSPLGYGSFEPDSEVIFDMVRAVGAPGGYLTRGNPMHITEIREVLRPGTITLAAVPQVLQFGRHGIPTGTEYIPLNADAELVVVDDRNAPVDREWYVTARATQAEDEQTGATLPPRALGIRKSGIFSSLETAVRVWQGDYSQQSGEQSIIWQAGDKIDGFVMEVNPYQAQAADFTAVVTWTLITGV